eukprot:218470_1
MANCPKSHGLKSFSTSHRGYTCDSCHKKASLYQQMYGCRKCNYDLCRTCYNKGNQVKKGSDSKLTTLFKKHYADKEDKEIMSEQGMLKFFKDCGVNPESHETLIIAYHLQCGEMGIFEKEEFVKGFAKSGCSTKKEMKSVITDKIRQINNNQSTYKLFYKWIFKHVREDEKKKSIPTELAIQLWNLVFTKNKNNLKLLALWVEYCESVKDSDMKVISRDVWEQIYDFLKETKSIESYDDCGGAWPVAVDEFIEWAQEKKQKK